MTSLYPLMTNSSVLDLLRWDDLSIEGIYSNILATGHRFFSWSCRPRGTSTVLWKGCRLVEWRLLSR